jgi:hypothetical protein
MVTTLKRGATKKNIQNILENLSKKLKPKGVDVYQYVGKISLQKDALVFQKALRNEWE